MYMTLVNRDDICSESDLREMYCKEMMSQRLIADKIGVSGITISRWLKKYGIKSRTYSESHLNGLIKPSKEDLKKMYCEKMMSQRLISDKIGVSRSTIINWMKEYDIKPRTYSELQLGDLPKLSKEELCKMYCDKFMSSFEIAEDIGVSHTTILNWMHAYGIETRMLSEYIGEKAGGWKGGISGGKYCYKFNNTFKEAVRVRDDYTCQLCQFEQKPDGRKLDVHHIHYDKDNCWPDVIVLCRSCHLKTTTGNRDYWEEYFENQLLERGLYCWSIGS